MERFWSALPNGISPSYKLLDAYFETIKTRLVPNYGEFAIIKIGVVDFLPNTDELESIAVTRSIGDEEIPILGIQHIGEADIILSFDFYYIDFGILYCNFCYRIVSVWLQIQIYRNIGEGCPYP